MNQAREMAEFRARIEALEWRLESAFGPNEETHPMELWKEIAALRVKTEEVLRSMLETQQSQLAEIADLRSLLTGLRETGLN